MIDAVLSALQAAEVTREQAAGRAEIDNRVTPLTPREREVCEELAAGNQSKVIAHNLGMSRARSRSIALGYGKNEGSEPFSAPVRVAVGASVAPTERPKYQPRACARPGNNQHHL